MNTEIKWTLRLKDGIQIAVPADIQHPITQTLLEYETWPEPELTFLRQLVQPGMHLLDIDTGLGCHALSLAKALQGQGNLIALNPDPFFSDSVAENDDLRALIVTTTSLPQPAIAFDLIRLGARPVDPTWLQQVLQQADPLLVLANTPEQRAALQAHENLRLFRLVPGIDALVVWTPEDKLEPPAILFACNANRITLLQHQQRLIGPTVEFGDEKASLSDKRRLNKLTRRLLLQGFTKDIALNVVEIADKLRAADDESFIRESIDLLSESFNKKKDSISLFYLFTHALLNEKALRAYDHKVDESIEKALLNVNWSYKTGLYAWWFSNVHDHRDKNSSPKCSVIVICNKYKEETGQNIDELIHQCRQIGEVIYVNNGDSSIEAKKIIDKADVYLELKGNSGAYLARNIGALHASGSILLFIDDDGFPEPGLVKAHIDAHEKYQLDCVRGAYLPKNPNEKPPPHYYLGEEMRVAFNCLEGNCSYRRDLFYKMGGWGDYILFGHGGAELTSRMLRQGSKKKKHVYIPNCILRHDYYRGEKHAKNKQKKQSESLDILNARGALNVKQKSEAYNSALESALATQDSKRALTDRYQQLRGSRDDLAALSAVGDHHIATQLLRLHVWTAFGEPLAARQLTISLLDQRKASDSASYGVQNDLRSRPFPPAAYPQFDCSPPYPPESDLEPLLNAKLFETYLHLNAQSRRDKPEIELPLLIQRRKLPYASIESERMLALLLLRLKKKVVIKPGSRLLTVGNNAWIWLQLGEKNLAPDIVQKATLVFYPSYSNPYQKLLYGIFPESVSVMPGLPWSISVKPQGVKIFHMHWEDSIYRGAKDEQHAFNLIDRFLGRIEEAVSNGWKIIWTIHNETPHENVYPAADQRIRGALVRLADMVLVHSDAALNIVANAFPGVKGKIQVFPLGNYKGYYLNTVSCTEAREKLKIPKSATTFLFFGAIRPYKGLDDLLRAFSHPSIQSSNAILIIAGSGGAAYEYIKNYYSGDHGKLRVLDHRVEDDEVQYCFLSADYSIFSFKKILTSSSILLSLTFHVPILVPRFSSLLEFLDVEIGFSYDVKKNNPMPLVQVLRQALSTTHTEREKLRQNAAVFSSKYDWGNFRNIAERIVQALTVSFKGEDKSQTEERLKLTQATDVTSWLTIVVFGKSVQNINVWIERHKKTAINEFPILLAYSAGDYADIIGLSYMRRVEISPHHDDDVFSRVFKSLSMVKTPFVMLCASDDEILKLPRGDSLPLTSHVIAGFRPVVLFRYPTAIMPARSNSLELNNNNPTNRLSNFWTHPFPADNSIFYSILKTSVISDSLAKIAAVGHDFEAADWLLMTLILKSGSLIRSDLVILRDKTPPLNYTANYLKKSGSSKKNPLESLFKKSKTLLSEAEYELIKPKILRWMQVKHQEVMLLTRE